MEKSFEINKRKKSGLSKFTFFVFLPLLVIMVIVLIVTTILDINIFDQAKHMTTKIPFLSSENDQLTEEYGDQIVSLQAEIQDRTIEVKQLEQTIEKKEEEIDQQAVKIKQLEDTIGELEQIQEDNKRAFKEIVTTFESMAPKKAAPIIIEMQENEAIELLSAMNVEILAKILEQMPAKDAAGYMEKITVTKKGVGNES